MLAAIGVLSLVAGIALGSALVAVTVALVLYLARQLWIVRQLSRALGSGTRLEPPFPGGQWREIFDAVRRLQVRSRKRKRRLNRFVARFQDAAAALPDAVVIVGRGNRIEWLNPAASRLLGLDVRGSVGLPIGDCVREPVFVEYLVNGDFSRPLEIPAPANSRMMLSILVTPFGRRRQRVLVARDITRAYHLDQARTDFVANVSHELRTPLTVLSGNLELLDERQREHAGASGAVESMRSNVARMQALVTDLLTLSRLEMGRAEQTESIVDVPALIQSIVRDAQVLTSRTHHVIRLDVAPDLCVRGVESVLRGAFTNLVSNAIRHTPPRTLVNVSWRRDGEGARLAVTDTGPGIAARHIPRLTERFYRVDASRSLDSGGTGLGLAIVKHALERHDATLNVESREGAGCTFECHFPSGRIDATHDADVAGEQRPPADARQG